MFNWLGTKVRKYKMYKKDANYINALKFDLKRRNKIKEMDEKTYQKELLKIQKIDLSLKLKREKINFKRRGH